MNRLIAYLGILACIILGGILGLIASVLILAALVALGIDIDIYHILIGIALGAFIGGVLAVIHVRRYTRKQADMQFAKCLASVPKNAGDLIKAIIGEMRYRKKVQDDVMSELIAHFEDELKDCPTDEEKEKRAEKLITDFGDVKLLAVLMRRAKKRCRPLWQTTVIRSLQTIGVVIGLCCLYTVWFISGKPTIRVDYLAVLNKENKPAIPDENNAWTYYEKAMEIFIKPDKSIENLVYETKLTDNLKILAPTNQQIAAIKKWLNKNESAWQQVKAGSLKEYCRYKKFVYTDNQKCLVNAAYPYVVEFNNLRKLGFWHAFMELKNDNIQQAIEDCFVLLSLSRNLRKDGVIVEHFIGTLIDATAYHVLLHVIETKKLSSADLKVWQEQLEQLYLQGYPMIDTEEYRTIFLDTTQQAFTKGGLGGGHLIPQKLIYFDGVWSGDGGVCVWTGDDKHIRFPSFYPFYIAASMIHARRDEMIAKGNELYDKINELLRMSPYQWSVKGSKYRDFFSTLPRYRYFMLPLQAVPVMRRRADLVFQKEAEYKAVITIFALQRWQLNNGEYPQDLDELITAGYLHELPMDPYSDKSLLYKKTDDGFILYSVGPDFTDDGGTVAVVNGRPQRWGTKNEGDAVFWPVPK